VPILLVFVILDYRELSKAVITALASAASKIKETDELINLLTSVLEIFAQMGLKIKCNHDTSSKIPLKVDILV
jgi:hypothetical protein